MNVLRELLGELEQNTIDWFETTLGGTGFATRFTGDDLASVPKIVTFESFIEQMTITRGDQEWAASMVHSQRPLITSNTLALFIHNDVNQKLIPCQADVNGKRFVNKLVGEGTQTKICNVVAVPYMMLQHEDSETAENSNKACRVRPMTYEDTMEVAKVSGPTYVGHAQQITKAATETTFKVLFGFDSLPEVDEDSVLSIYFMILLHGIQAHFDVCTQVGCKKLLMAIARNILKDDVVHKLNELCIPVNKLVDVTLAIFSAVVPLRLGFLSGESFVARAHSDLLSSQCDTRNAPPSFPAAVTIMEPAGDYGFPHILMKKTSNAQTSSDRQNHTSGSIMDFVLEALLEYIAQPDDPFPENNKQYKNAHERIVDSAIERIIQASKHNPDIDMLKRGYERKRAMAEGKDIEDVKLENKEYRDQIGASFMRCAYKANKLLAGSKSEGPVDLFVLVMLLTDFADKTGTEVLANFLKTNCGVSYFATAQDDSLVNLTSCLQQNFLPLGIGGAVDFQSFRLKWHSFKRLQFDMATIILDNYTQINTKDKSLRDRKVQVHRLARKLSKSIFHLMRLPGIKGGDVDIGSYPNFSRELQSEKGDLLYTTAMWLIKVVHHSHTEANDECPVKYGNAFVRKIRGTSPPILALHKINLESVFHYGLSDISPFKLIRTFLDREEDEHVHLWQMVEEGISQVKLKKNAGKVAKSKRNNKKHKEGGWQDEEEKRNRKRQAPASDDSEDDASAQSPARQARKKHCTVADKYFDIEAAVGAEKQNDGDREGDQLDDSDEEDDVEEERHVRKKSKLTSPLEASEDRNKKSLAEVFAMAPQELKQALGTLSDQIVPGNSTSVFGSVATVIINYLSEEDNKRKEEMKEVNSQLEGLKKVILKLRQELAVREEQSNEELNKRLDQAKLFLVQKENQENGALLEEVQKYRSQQRDTQTVTAAEFSDLKGKLEKATAKAMVYGRKLNNIKKALKRNCCKDCQPKIDDAWDIKNETGVLAKRVGPK